MAGPPGEGQSLHRLLRIVVSLLLILSLVLSIFYISLM